jgi:asparagine synthase (glutamine-hydrolysing)
MCGICGVYSFERKAEPELLAPVRHLTGLMRRRGPDDDGLWSDGHCAFGFRRLSILDLSPAGHQPMRTEDGRYTLIFNGEVYNFQEIRRRLEARGICFRSSGDTEVLLYALAEWGTAALEQFNGMFALAFYDLHEKRLLLARDHAGIKPLHYLRVEQGLVFGSQYDQILQHPWARGIEVSQEALGLYLRFGTVQAPYAMLKQSYQLEAGSWMTIDSSGELKHGRFYEFPRFPIPDLHGEAAVDALDEAFSRAVERHMISDVPVGVFLSGGIDSPLVAAEARRHTGQELKAFSIGVSNSELDESSDASRYAQELGVEHVLRMVEPQAAVDLLDDVVTASTEPNADFSIFPTLLVSRLAREHVKVALSGDGGDELFWGYPSRFGSVIEQARHFRRPPMLRYGQVAARRYLKMGTATRDILWPNIGQLYQKKHTLMAFEDLDAIFPILPPVPQDFGLFNFTSSDADETAQWLRWNEFQSHLAFILQKVDRASMHNSLEVRVPLLDKEVIAVATRTDWKSCLDLSQRRGKIPLRRILNRRIKYESQGKKGFTVPMHDWLCGPLQALLQEHVLYRQDFLGLEVHGAHLQQMNRQLLAGNRYMARGLWQLLSLALWEQRHLAPQQSLHG